MLCHKKRADTEQSWKPVSTAPLSGNRKAPSSLLLQDSSLGTLDAGERREDSARTFRLQVKTPITSTPLPLLSYFSEFSPM